MDPDATSRLDGELSDKAMECFAFNISQTKPVMHMHDNPSQGARLNSTENWLTWETGDELQYCVTAVIPWVWKETISSEIRCLN